MTDKVSPGLEFYGGKLDATQERGPIIIDEKEFELNESSTEFLIQKGKRNDQKQVMATPSGEQIVNI